MNPIAPYDAAWTVIPILFVIIGMVVAVLVVLLIAWILYTVVWKGVRRGLEEYYGTRSPR